MDTDIVLYFLPAVSGIGISGLCGASFAELRIYALMRGLRCVSWFNVNRRAHLLMGLAIIERQSQLDTAHLVNDEAPASLLSLTNAAINYKPIMFCSLNIISIRHYIAPNL